MADEERFRPSTVVELFDEESDLTLKTETPSKMILHMVRLELIRSAINPKRKKPLLQVFREEFDKRMISKERKGRLELLAAMSAAAADEREEEGML